MFDVLARARRACGLWKNLNCRRFFFLSFKPVSETDPRVIQTVGRASGNVVQALATLYYLTAAIPASEHLSQVC